jgi:hypothetical protein
VRKLIICSLLLLISCTQPDRWVDYEIRKDFSHPTFRPIYLHASDTLNFECKFDSSYAYENQLINKLYGLSSGISSFQGMYYFGAKYHYGKVCIYAISNKYNETVIVPINEVNINKVYNAQINLTDSGTLFTFDGLKTFIPNIPNFQEKYIILIPYLKNKAPQTVKVSIHGKIRNDTDH